MPTPGSLFPPTTYSFPRVALEFKGKFLFLVLLSSPHPYRLSIPSSPIRTRSYHRSRSILTLPFLPRSLFIASPPPSRSSISEANSCKPPSSPLRFVDASSVVCKPSLWTPSPSPINRVALPPPPPLLIPRRGRSFSATAVRGIISSASRLQIYSSWVEARLGLGWVIDGNGTGWSIPYILREDDSGGTNCGSEMRIWPNLDRRGGVRCWWVIVSIVERWRDVFSLLLYMTCIIDAKMENGRDGIFLYLPIYF